MFDPVQKPAHYTEGRQYEPIAVIEDWELGYHLGCALKYIARAGRKDPSKTSQDISKAIWYLERFRGQLEAEPGPATLLDQLTSQALDGQEGAKFAAIFDPVQKPAHYTEGRQYEPIAVIEDWELGYHLGCALKYIARAGRKDPSKTSQDISKAIWYLERFRGQLEAEPGPATLLDQLAAKFAAMGELGSVAFGSDEDIPFSTDLDREEELWDPSLDPYDPVDRNGNPVKPLSQPDPTEIDTLPSEYEG